MRRLQKIYRDYLTLWFHSSYTIGQRAYLTWIYAKVICLNFLHGRALTVTHVRFLGMNWRIDDFGVFTLLLSEIFIEEPYYCSTLPQNARILDCGSNIGMTILYFKYKYPDASVVGFEPDPEVYLTLSDNLAVNHVSDVTIHNCALSNVEGEMRFYKRTDASIASSSLHVDPDKTEEISVRAMPLSHFVSTEFDFAKIDIQFSEALVLSELNQAGALPRVAHYVLEYHYRHDVVDNPLSSVIKAFEENQYDYTVRLDSDKPNRFRTYQIWASRVDA